MQVGHFVADDSGLTFVQPFDKRVLTDIHIPRGEEGGAEPGEMVTVAFALSGKGDDLSAGGTSGGKKIADARNLPKPIQEKIVIDQRKGQQQPAAGHGH